MFSSPDTFTSPPGGGLPPSTTMYTCQHAHQHPHQHAPPSPVTSIHSNSSWSSHTNPSCTTFCRVENHLKGCYICETTYRSLQQENHDLRKRMGEFKAKLAFADENLRQEGARQRALERCLAKLGASLEEARMRSVDVIEENCALREDFVRREGDQTHRPSPLDRQLALQLQSEEYDYRESAASLTSPPASPAPPAPPLSTLSRARANPTTAPRPSISSPTTSPLDDLATFQRTREARKANKKAKAQRERSAAFAAIPRSFYVRSHQEPSSPSASRPSAGPPSPSAVRPNARPLSRRRTSTISSNDGYSKTHTHQLQSAKRLPRPSAPCLGMQSPKIGSVRHDQEGHRGGTADARPTRRGTAPDLAVDELALSLARIRTAPS